MKSTAVDAVKKIPDPSDKNANWKKNSFSH